MTVSQQKSTSRSAKLKEETSLMDAASLAMDFANIINLTAVLLLMRTVIKDRKVLKGFSVSGTVLAWFGILGLEVGFFQLGNFEFRLGISWSDVLDNGFRLQYAKDL